MKNQSKYNLVIIGGGPTGLSAAISAKKNGIDNLLLLERENYLGGILNQCIHDGFGLHLFKESMTGPEYATKLIKKFVELKIPHFTKSMVTKLTQNKEIEYVNKNGYKKISSKAVILAMGCRERTRYNIQIPGSRPAGIFTAGTAQALVNMQNLQVGKKILILGSGDIGLIMARRLALEGMEVVGVYEIMPFSAGLKRNIQQCLKDYNIPLYLSKSITKIYGENRVEKVEISDYDEKLNVIPNSQEIIKCDTILLSVGLIPENELSKQAGIKINPLTNGAFVNAKLQTNIEGIFSAGNVLHIHDLADWASMEAEMSGKFASQFINNRDEKKLEYNVKHCDKINYSIPNTLIKNEKPLLISFRVKFPIDEPKVKITDKEKNIIFEKKYIKLEPSELTRIRIDKLINSDIFIEIVK